MVRSLSEILIDANNAESISELEKLWHELKSNRKHYPLVQYQFGAEHLDDLGRKEVEKMRLAIKGLI